MMSGYRGRTGPNVSEYLNNLNAVPFPYDQEQFQGEDINLDDNLALFTNTDFTHFDIPSLSDNALVDFDLAEDSTSTLPSNSKRMKYEDLLAAEPSDFFPNYNPPIQPAPAAHLPNSTNHVLPVASSPISPHPIVSQPANMKREADAAATPSISAEEQSRLAAEEDKRRRNTAASARFRVKKKQREQALEKTVKEITDKNATLEVKINQLEMENKWLKNLITEKNGDRSKEEIAEAYQKFRRESEEREVREASQTKKGVGTTNGTPE